MIFCKYLYFGDLIFIWSDLKGQWISDEGKKYNRKEQKQSQHLENKNFHIEQLYSKAILLSYSVEKIMHVQVDLAKYNGYD